MEDGQLKQRLHNLKERITGQTSSTESRSMWIHWSDVATINDAIAALESRDKQIEAINAIIMNQKKDN